MIHNLLSLKLQKDDLSKFSLTSNANSSKGDSVQLMWLTVRTEVSSTKMEVGLNSFFYGIPSRF